MHSSPRTYIADYIRSISNEGFSSADVAWASDWVRRGAFADSGGVSGTAAEVDNIEIRKKNMEASGFSSRAERKAFRQAMDETEAKSLEEASAAKTKALEDEVDALMCKAFNGTGLWKVSGTRVVRVGGKVFRIVIISAVTFGKYRFDLKNITQEHFRDDVLRELREIVDLFTEE